MTDTGGTGMKVRKIIIGFLTLLILFGWTAIPLAEEAAGKVNLNTATMEELVTLDGIGSGLAERIIAYRGENGGFSKTEDLLKVQGIGPKVFEANRDRLAVN